MTGRSNEETADITLLGNQKTQYPSDYAPEMLETFENKHQGNDYFVKFNCPEFTSLCPITGQPDFATVTISYVPNIKMVESKSLKLYLFSFRNHGDFHEDCMNIIMKDLIKLMDPIFFYLKIPRYSSKVHISVTSLNCSLTKWLPYYTIMSTCMSAASKPFLSFRLTFLISVLYSFLRLSFSYVFSDAFVSIVSGFLISET